MMYGKVVKGVPMIQIGNTQLKLKTVIKFHGFTKLLLNDAYGKNGGLK